MAKSTINNKTVTLLVMNISVSLFPKMMRVMAIYFYPSDSNAEIQLDFK